MADKNVVDDIKNLNNTHDHTSEFGSQDIDDNKLISILSYIGILFLIPLFVRKDSAYARYHVNQGLVLFVAELVWSVIFKILSVVLGWIPVVGILVSVIGWVVEVIFLVLAIIGIINTINGKAKDLPVIGKVRIIK